ncbi:MAG: pseudouridine synthase [Tepidisphaerales bacterium]
MAELEDQIEAETADADADTEADVEHYRFVPSRTLTRRIDQYLVDRVPHLSRAGVQRLIDDDLVTVNGKPTKASYKPKAGDEIVMVAPPKPVSELIPENIPLDIVYEDEHFLALNKQAGLMVHPARGKWTGTLVNGLVFYGAKWSGVSGNWRPGILHRLDRNTTGIMLVAKSDEAHWRIARQFEKRTIQKTYVAICHGVPELLSDVIDLPIGRDRYVRERQAIRKEANGGRPAITIYHVEEKFEDPPELALVDSTHEKDQAHPSVPGRFALLRLLPKTGRTHQLRVHMAARGRPLVGDTMYGGRNLEYGDFRFDRQALHAAEITLIHPGTLEPMTLKAPLPPDMERLLEILRSRKH